MKISYRILIWRKRQLAFLFFIHTMDLGYHVDETLCHLSKIPCTAILKQFKSIIFGDNLPAGGSHWLHTVLLRFCFHYWRGCLMLTGEFQNFNENYVHTYKRHPVLKASSWRNKWEMWRNMDARCHVEWLFPFGNGITGEQNALHPMKTPKMCMSGDLQRYLMQTLESIAVLSLRTILLYFYSRCEFLRSSFIRECFDISVQIKHLPWICIGKVIVTCP